MENHLLWNKLLKDEKLIKEDSRIIETLEKNNIITLWDLFMTDLTSIEVNSDLRKLLNGITTLVKYKYQDLDLNEVLYKSLDRNIHYVEELNEFKNLTDFELMGFSENEIERMKAKMWFYRKSYFNKKEECYLIDFFRLCNSGDLNHTSLGEKLTIYINCYDKQQLKQTDDCKEFKTSLQERLNQLYNLRTHMDVEISKGENQLNLIKEEENKNELKLLMKKVYQTPFKTKYDKD